MGVALRGDRNQCPCCHKLFNSTHAFDQHRTGDMADRRCLNTWEMLSKGMVEGVDKRARAVFQQAEVIDHLAVVQRLHQGGAFALAAHQPRRPLQRGPALAAGARRQRHRGALSR